MSDLSGAAKASLEAVRRSDGKFGTQPHSNPGQLSDRLAGAASRSDDRVVEPCRKCAGTGRIEAFSGIANGVCFACGGGGTRSILKSSIKARQRRDAQRRAENAAQAEKARQVGEVRYAEAVEMFSDTPDVVAALETHGETWEPGHVQAWESYRLVAERGWTPEKAVAEWKYATDREPRDWRPNRRRGVCRTCGAKVTRGAGVQGETRNQIWTYCTGCAAEA